jgi:hypothetical protein
MESDNEAKKICEVMTLGEKIKMLGKLRGDVCAEAVGLTLRWYFILKFIFSLILFCITQFVNVSLHYIYDSWFTLTF